MCKTSVVLEGGHTGRNPSFFAFHCTMLSCVAAYCSVANVINFVITDNTCMQSQTFHFELNAYAHFRRNRVKPTAEDKYLLECGPMLNVMAALTNIGDALCSTPQSLANAQSVVQ